MDTTDIVKRILNLKKMSVELKETTSQNSSMDVSFMKNILTNSKQQNRQMIKIEEKQKEQGGQTNLNGILSQLNNIQITERHLGLTDEQQISNLRKQNEQLEFTLKNLQQELLELEKLQKQGKEQSWKDGLPYFTMQSELLAFMTKLTIHEKNYDKIDYFLHSISLTMDRITLRKKNKKQIREVQLKDLKEVHYIDPNIMLLQFKKQAEHQTIFIQFQTKEKLQTWDRAFYVNYKIIQTLNKDAFNLMENDVKKSQVAISEQSIKSAEYKDLMKIYLQKKEKHAEKEQITKQKILQKISSKKKIKQLEKIESNQSSPFVKFDNTPSKAQLEEEAHNQSPNSLYEKTSREDTSKFNFFGDMGKFLADENTGDRKRQEEENEKKEELRMKEEKQRMKREEEERQEKNEREEIEERRKKEEELKKMMQKQAEEEMQRRKKLQEIQEQMKYQKSVQTLKQGYQLTKYAVGGFKSHEKIVFLSSKGERLCWVEKGEKLKDDAKHILISEILEVNQGETGPGIEKHEDKDSLKKNCFICIHLDSKERKMVEFGGKTPEQVRNFSLDLDNYRRKSKQIK